MKIYFKNLDNEISLTIYPSNNSNSELFHYLVYLDDKNIDLYFKQGRTKNFFSTDKKTWTAISRCSNLTQTSINNQVFNIHFGFLPSKNSEEKEGSLVSKMPGKVVKILKMEGEKVSIGEPILIIEAMKMENEIKANKIGIIEKICVSPGQNINAGEMLAIIS